MPYLHRNKTLPGQHYKKSETMKKFFLAAVAISALCSSCETADETYLKESNYESLNAQRTNGLNNTDYEVYKNILERFAYNNDQNYIENVLRFEKHVNLSLNYYTDTNSYESLNMEKLAFLSNSDESIIDKLYYSAEFKNALYYILYSSRDAGLPLKSEKENSLIITLVKVHNDKRENGDDDLFDKNKRTIAFAYGAQYSFHQAVLYAGAIELKGN